MHQSLEVGQVESLLTELPRLEGGTPETKAAARALRGGLFLAGHPEGRPVGAADLSTKRTDATPYLRLFGVFQARLRGDVEALEFLSKLSEPTVELDVLAARMAEQWRLLWGGSSLDDALLTDAEGASKHAGFGDLSVEFTVLRALSASAQMRFEEALVHARRASRMGHTEHRPQSEYAAHIVLARARRHSGMPYLAARILSSLWQVLPDPWRGWGEVEVLLSGSTTDGSPSTGGRFDPLKGELRSLGAERTPAAQGTAHWPGWMRAELGDLFACLHGQREPETERALGWISGEGALPPWGIHAVAGAEVGYVCVPTDRATYRTLAKPPQPIQAVLEEREPRTERGLGALAFAEGRTLRVDDFFERVYGFAFDQGLHGSWLRTLLMRMRKALEQVGDIERIDDALKLVVHRPFSVRDPRCALEPAEQVLQLIANDGAIGARQAAGKLGVPLRTVQRTLKSLVDEGICQADRSARKVVYKIEDTTFHEPTTSYRAQYMKS